MSTDIKDKQKHFWNNYLACLSDAAQACFVYLLRPPLRDIHSYSTGHATEATHQGLGYTIPYQAYQY